MNSEWKSQCPLQTLKQRAFLMSAIREYFAQQNVLEVETPILSSAGNTDVNIESFTSQNIHSDCPKSYLRTSPEFPLKRLLCSGIGDIFEIGKVFRKGEISKTHNIEFTVLEWYKIGFDYNQLIQDVIGLFGFIFAAFNQPFKNIDTLSFGESFQQYLSIDLSLVTVEQLNQHCTNFSYSGSQLSRDEALDFLFATQIQPKLNKENLTFITLYPASQAALSQINPQDPSTSLRFEVFYQGHELGNGYQELTDSQELLKRFKQDNQQRQAQGKQVIDIDYRLLSAMENGMPACSGIAMGLDRLLMVLLGCERIEKVLSFNSGDS